MVKINFPSRVQQNLSTAEEKIAGVTQKSVSIKKMLTNGSKHHKIINPL